MSGRAIQKDSTSQSTVIRIIDSTDGTPELSVEHNTAGIDLWYRREGAVKTSITEAALASLDAAYSSGGIEHIGDGYYRLDLPDAAFATGSDGVTVGGTVTGMIVIGTYHPLVAYNPQDSVRLGLTAMPNAAADGAGGLPISDAGGLDLDALNTAAVRLTAARAQVLDDWINAGRLDALLDGVKAVTDALPNAGALTDLATAAALTTAQNDLDILTGTDGATLATAQALYAPAKSGDLMGLANDAITAAKYDETTAFPVISADTGATQIARVGADSDTLETLSDQLDAASVIITAIQSLLDDARAEPGQGAPSVNPDAVTKIDYLYKAWRNKVTQDATTYELYNDAGTVVDQKATVSDDGTDFTRAEIVSGP